MMSSRSGFSRTRTRTVLDPTLTSAQLRNFVAENGKAGFTHVCIPLTMVGDAKAVVAGKLPKLEGWEGVQIAAVIGFPHGNESTTRDKVRQVEYAAYHSADEVDFVINIGLLRSDEEKFKDEVKRIARAAHDETHMMKVKAIFETYYLSNEEITKVAGICEEAGVDFVKTSTGFATKGKNHKEREADAENIGATRNAILLMGKGVKDKSKVGIKLAGGIRTKDQLAMLLMAAVEAGWDKDMVRIGCSAGKQIIDEIGKVQHIPDVEKGLDARSSRR